MKREGGLYNRKPDKRRSRARGSGPPLERRATAGRPDSTKFLKMSRATTRVCNIKLTYAAMKGKVRDEEASLSGLFSTDMELQTSA